MCQVCHIPSVFKCEPKRRHTGNPTAEREHKYSVAVAGITVTVTDDVSTSHLQLNVQHKHNKGATLQRKECLAVIRAGSLWSALTLTGLVSAARRVLHN